MNNQKRSGQNFRGLLNDLKRRPKDAANELGFSLEHIQDVIEGTRPITNVLIKEAVKFWPVNERDFYIIQDDAPEGVRFMTAEESSKTSRIMNRAGKPYYEYRDTAMSKVGPFRPEWIKELCVVENNDPTNENVQWNNGHFMHQFTYFIGPVNFYYKGENGEKKVAVMNTGDTMYITPFVPHTFTTRKNEKGEEGVILALTYGNSVVGDAQHELSAMGTDLASEVALDFSTIEKASGSLIKRRRQNASLSHVEITRRTQNVISVQQLQDWENGLCLPTLEELKILAKALQVDIHDLLAPTSLSSKVIVQKFEDAPHWDYPKENPAYNIVQLAGTKHLPNSRSLELTLLKENNTEFDLQVGLHQWGYNVGDSPITMKWELDGQIFSKVILPGDSFYTKPYIKHSFGGRGKVLLLRIGGKISGDVQRELSLIGKENTQRAVAETVQWYNVKGRKDV